MQMISNSRMLSAAIVWPAVLTAFLSFLSIFSALVPGQGVANSRVRTPDLLVTPELAKIFAGGEPQTLAQLDAMESYLQALLAKILPSTVNIGGATGVIVPGGFVLTAGHVSRHAGRSISIILDDGRRVKTRSLGLSNRTDTGLLKIITRGDFPALQMGHSSSLAPGAWCVMLGFPGGMKPGLKPPLRLGRVLRVVDPGRGYLVTDCTMSAGDSGGPLFDMQGRVIGINSRISRDLAMNMHTPIDAFHEEWSRLVKGEVMGRGGRRRGAPPTPGWLGALADESADLAKVRHVVPGSPAAKAGVEVGDVIVKLNSRRIRSSRTFARQEKRLYTGERVRIIVRRGNEERILNATVGTAPPGEHKPKVDKPRKRGGKVIR